MASTFQSIAHPPNRLDDDAPRWIPYEIKMMILEYTSSHDDLVSLLEAYPEWVRGLWERYPKQLFTGALENVFSDIDPEVDAEVIFVYYIRQIRKNYATAMESSDETQLDRNLLEAKLRDLLDLSVDFAVDLEESLQTILDIAEVVRDVNSLTNRYVNDAWKRIHEIAEKTGPRSYFFEAVNNPPAIHLTRMERFKFNRAFLRVEIYLLTKYWTNAKDERHILDMDEHIEPFIPHSDDYRERAQFDSCLRYIFHAYRGYLKKTARELGAPELPIRDDFQWVRNWNEDYEYQYQDSPTLTPGNPEIDFAQRSVSEEQRFLLWLCEFGIGPLEKTHQVDDSTRRDELLLQFSCRHIWDTVELRHRVSRYDVAADRMISSYQSRLEDEEHRNRHPIMSLYGHGAHQQYSATSSPWACASAFLEWEWEPTAGAYNYAHLRSWGGVTLNEPGRWLTLSDTDKGAGDWNPFWRKDRAYIPHGHPYMLDLEIYELRPIPQSIFLIHP